MSAKPQSYCHGNIPNANPFLLLEEHRRLARLCIKRSCGGTTIAWSWFCVTVWHKTCVFKKSLFLMWVWAGNSPLPGHPTDTTFFILHTDDKSPWRICCATSLRLKALTLVTISACDEPSRSAYEQRTNCSSCFEAKTSDKSLALTSTMSPHAAFTKWPFRNAISKVTSLAGDTQVSEWRWSREHMVIQIDQIYGLTRQIMQWSREWKAMRPRKKIEHVLYSSLNNSVRIDRKYNLKQFT